jgi:diaminobutyrate-2-oxoglutarate transaminase
MIMQVFEKWESNIRGYSRMYPTVFSSASNARQMDADGKSYVDFFAGAGVLNFGHNNPRMKKAIVEFIEADGIAHSLDMATTTKQAFMEKFISTVLEPREMNYKMQFMGPTGTNAVEAALKLARKVTGRSNVVAFTSGFHGMTLGSLACTGNEYFRQAAGVALNDVHRLPFETKAGGGVDQINEFRCALSDSSCGIEKPAAFIVEPIQAEGGVNVASKEWLLAVQQAAHEIGALFIVDDIQAGCGRTGSYFSFDGMGLDPDVITLAKGLGGFGTPIAMNLIKPEHDIWTPGEHTGTFRGQGLSFVAGREGLGYFDDDTLMKDVKRKGQIMRERLEKIAKEQDAPPQTVRGKGMMQAYDFRDGAVAKAVTKACFENGMLICPCGTGGQVLKLVPPLTIPDEDLEEGLNILESAINEVGVAA